MPKIVDHQEQRRAIAAVAAQWIARRGLETLSLRNIAAAHGCSKGMVQHYFSDKEELLFGALLYVTQEYEARAEAATQGVTGLERLDKRFCAILPLNESLRDDWVVRLAFYARAALVPRMQNYIKQHVQSALRVGANELRTAQRNGEVRKGINVNRAYRGIMATVAGIAVAEVASPRSIPHTTQKRMLRDALALLTP